MESECFIRILKVGGNELVVELTESAKKRLERMAIKSIKEECRAEEFEKSVLAMEMIKKGAALEETSKVTRLSMAQINQLCSFI